MLGWGNSQVQIKVGEEHDPTLQSLHIERNVAARQQISSGIVACGTCHRPNELTALAVVTAYDQGVLAEKTARKTVPSVPVSRFVSFWTAGLQYPLKHILRLRRARTWAGLGCRFTSCWVEGQRFLMVFVVCVQQTCLRLSMEARHGLTCIFQDGAAHISAECRGVCLQHHGTVADGSEHLRWAGEAKRESKWATADNLTTQKVHCWFLTVL